MIRNFQEFKLDDLSYMSNPQFPDKYCELDKTFTDFDLRHVQTYLLEKSFRNFKIYLMPLFLDNCFLLPEREHITDINKIKSSLFDKYLPLDDWQFDARCDDGVVKIMVVIPNVDDNVEMLIEDMSSIGYVETFRNEMSEQGYPYTLIRFNSICQK